jgi:hypothetical protein
MLNSAPYQTVKLNVLIITFFQQMISDAYLGEWTFLLVKVLLNIVNFILLVTCICKGNAKVGMER